MYWKIQEGYFWFDMAKHCKQYAFNCPMCKWTKAYTIQKQSLLNPLLISNKKWIDLLFDFVVKLPKCRQQNCVFQHIFVVVDQLTKRRLYKPLKTLHTSKFIDTIYYCIFALYRFLLTTINDWRGQITLTLWRQLCKRYGINIKFSSAHHPKTDGQIESANRVIKNYLQAYTAYTQDDWVNHLPMAEFATNNHVNTFTDVTSFFADHSFHPWTNIEPPRMYKGEGEQRTELLATNKIVAWQAEMMTFLQDLLVWSQDKQTQFANRTRQPYLEYKIGDNVYVDAKHFASEQDKKSLNLKNAGPWEIVQNINNKICKLKIPQTLKDAGFTPIFHLWKMHVALDNAFLGQILPPGPPIKISTEDDNK